MGAVMLTSHDQLCSSRKDCICEMNGDLLLYRIYNNSVYSTCIN